MYENNNKINWVGVLIKLALIIIFVVLIIKFFPVPKLDTFYNRVYSDNLSSMKEVAENYFTNDNLPKQTGDTSTLRLKDMIDKKLIVEFVDKNNKACNTTNSYAQVTKTESDKYVLKVQLACDDNTDYVLENLDTLQAKCSSTSCDSNSNSSDSSSVNTNTKNSKNISDEDQKELEDMNSTYDKDGSKLEYEYKRAITKTTSSYTCPEGYVLDGNVCYKEAQGETINATALYFEDVVVREKAKENKGDKYKVYIDANKEVDTVDKVCPEGYTLSGNICYKYEQAQINPGTTTYSCPEGYTLDGTKCTIEKDITTIINKTEGFTCPSDEYTLNGDKCTRYFKPARLINNWTCPEGYTQNGNTCSRNLSDTCENKETAKWENPKTTVSKTKLSTYSTPTAKRWLVNSSSTARGNTYEYQYQNAYCNSGELREDGYCYSTYTCNQRTETIDATANYINSCNMGIYDANSDTCVDTTNAIKTAASSIKESCPAGYKINGDKCTRTIDATPNTTETTYSCPTGYIKEGTTCYQYTEATDKENYKYSCPEGYEAEGEGIDIKCSKYIESEATYYCENADEKLIDDMCEKTIKGALKGYDCPTGYTLNNDKCIKRTTITIKPNEITNSNTTYEYKWSDKTSLDGWTPTGKTRTIKNTTINKYEK